MASTPSVVVVGIGELGAVFANGLLKLGFAVVPITRRQSIAETLVAAADAELVLVTVGEEALGGVLREIPSTHKGRVGLVQNELVPRDWQRAGLDQPSGVVVWFEKKAGRPVHVVQKSLAYGAKRELLAEALGALSIEVGQIGQPELPFELALKNLYILVHNLAGLRTGGTVGALWREHVALAEAVTQDVLRHQEAVLGVPMDGNRLKARLAEAVAADPEHACAGRTARQRLARVLKQAAELGVRLHTLPTLVDSRE